MKTTSGRSALSRAGNGPRASARHGVVVGAIALAFVAGCTPQESTRSADEPATESTSSATTQDDAADATSSTTSTSDTSSDTSAGSDDADETQADADEAAPASADTEEDTGSSDTQASDDTLYRVIRVVDGDTVKVDINGGESVRVIGIDTPETVDPDEPIECGGPEASAAAERLLDGQEVALEFDESQGRRDRYGRMLAYIEIPGSGDFGETMIRQGHAKEYTYASAYERQAAYRAAEDQAEQSGQGLWDSCTQQPEQAPTTSSAPSPSTTEAPPAPQAPEPAPSAPPAPEPKGSAPGPGWTNDALTPGYTGCRQGYPGGKIDGVYWWKPISC